MHIGILQCDSVRAEHQKKHSDYPEMFERLLKHELASLTFTTYCCMNNEFPTHSIDCDSWIITGSKYACYENLPWMLKLEDFIRELYINQRPCIGICFGHQIMAQALGGVIKKSEKGWGMGVTTINMFDRTSWATPFKNPVYMLVSHQDQVVQLPEDTKIIAGSNFCPYFILSYGNCFMSIQGHPEFTKEYERTLIQVRRTCIGNACEDGAIASLSQPIDNSVIAQWMLHFLQKNWQ